MPSSPNRLFLLRHAKAAAAKPGERDQQRELDLTGRREAAFIGEEMHAAGWHVDVCITSAATRCRQTSDIVLAAFGSAVPVDVCATLYDGNAETYLSVLSGRSESAVMIVGHNPTMEELFERLAGTEDARHHLPGGYPTAGLAVLDRTDAGEWRVSAVVTP